MLVGAVPGDRYEFEFPGRDQKTVDRAGSGDCGTPLLASQPASLHCTEPFTPLKLKYGPYTPYPHHRWIFIFRPLFQALCWFTLEVWCRYGGFIQLANI